MHDDRLPLAQAYQRATRGVTVAILMVAPGLLGYWIDGRLGTRAVFTIVGFGLGMSCGIMQLIRMGQPGRTGEPCGDTGRDIDDSAESEDD